MGREKFVITVQKKQITRHQSSVSDTVECSIEIKDAVWYRDARRVLRGRNLR
jgi:hypothetical protein